jgi:hypothetical protein
MNQSKRCAAAATAPSTTYQKAAEMLKDVDNFGIGGYLHLSLTSCQHRSSFTSTLTQSMYTFN